MCKTIQISTSIKRATPNGLVWNSTTEQQFYALRNAVADITKVYFMNENWPVLLEIDASDYGIGSVLAQVEPTTHAKLPIQFASKSLTGPQLRYVIRIFTLQISSK